MKKIYAILVLFFVVLTCLKAQTRINSSPIFYEGNNVGITGYSTSPQRTLDIYQYKASFRMGYHYDGFLEMFQNFGTASYMRRLANINEKDFVLGTFGYDDNSLNQNLHFYLGNSLNDGSYYISFGDKSNNRTFNIFNNGNVTVGFDNGNMSSKFSVNGGIYANDNICLPTGKSFRIGNVDGVSPYFAITHNGAHSYVAFNDNLYLKGNGTSKGLVVEENGDVGVGYSVSKVAGATHVPNGYVFGVNGTSYFNGNLTTEGNFGIGTDDPQAKLSIKMPDAAAWEKVLYVENSDRSATFGINNIGNTSSTYAYGIKGYSKNSISALYIDANHEGTNMGGRGVITFDAKVDGKEAAADVVVYEFCSNWDKRLAHMTGDGSFYIKGDLEAKGKVRASEVKVELMTTNTLDVEGEIFADQVKVKANGNTADFVFEDDYNLKDLNEVEAFIKANGHLPEIPSAEAMEAEGVDLAEMNKLLLQKIEELTLYTIEQDKEKQNMKSEFESLKEELAVIKAMLAK